MFPSNCCSALLQNEIFSPPFHSPQSQKKSYCSWSWNSQICGPAHLSPSSKQSWKTMTTNVRVPVNIRLPKLWGFFVLLVILQNSVRWSKSSNFPIQPYLNGYTSMHKCCFLTDLRKPTLPQSTAWGQCQNAEQQQQPEWDISIVAGDTQLANYILCHSRSNINKLL